MLVYKAHNNLRTSASGECNRIVVYNENGDPVTFVIQVGRDQYLTSCIGNKDFKGLLDTLNITKLNIKDE